MDRQQTKEASEKNSSPTPNIHKKRENTRGLQYKKFEDGTAQTP